MFLRTKSIEWRGPGVNEGKGIFLLFLQDTPVCLHERLHAVERKGAVGAGGEPRMPDITPDAGMNSA
jgi:hypothetical protein